MTGRAQEASEPVERIKHSVPPPMPCADPNCCFRVAYTEALRTIDRLESRLHSETKRTKHERFKTIRETAKRVNDERPASLQRRKEFNLDQLLKDADEDDALDEAFRLNPPTTITDDE